MKDVCLSDVLAVDGRDTESVLYLIVPQINSMHCSVSTVYVNRVYVTCAVF